ncbi:MAG: hypothetical protein ACTIJJ_08630 [Galactobacter sp.]|uniref:hypothetical protein n=1 Tax=Galactobacter sp. TaxID=2676125 RepID=UPI0025C2A668|nr:hypothetical protein [Galactobacter sp.]
MTAKHRPGLRWVGIACVAGLIHASFSCYWGLGGAWLLDTVGQGMVQALDGALWLLIPVGVFKAV